MQNSLSLKIAHQDCDDNNSCTVDVCVRGECHNIPPKFVDRECEEEKKKHKHHEDDDFEHHGHGHGDEDEEEEEEEEENSRYHPRDPHDDVDDEHRGHGHGDVDENLPHPPPSHDKDGPDCDEEHFRCHRYDTECRVDECMVFECTCPEEGEFEWHPAPRGVLCNEWDECGRFECNGRGSCVFKDGAEKAECSAHGENVALGITLAVVIPVVALLIYCLLIFFGGGRRGLRERQASSVGRWED